MSFDFDTAALINENQHAMGFEPIDLEVPDFDLLWGVASPEDPVEFRQALGSAVADIMLGGSVGLIIISDGFVEMLERLRATGWHTYPVRCTSKLGVIHGLHGLSVTGRSGPPDWHRSTPVIKPPLAASAPVRRDLRGFFFDEATWDGSDVFVPDGTGFVVVVGRIANALRAAKLRNLRVTPLSEYEFPHFAAIP